MTLSMFYIRHGSQRDISKCIKSDKPLVVYIYSNAISIKATSNVNELAMQRNLVVYKFWHLLSALSLFPSAFMIYSIVHRQLSKIF